MNPAEKRKRIYMMKHFVRRLPVVFILVLLLTAELPLRNLAAQNERSSKSPNRDLGGISA